jgi:hypothetical protein
VHPPIFAINIAKLLETSRVSFFRNSAILRPSERIAGTAAARSAAKVVDSSRFTADNRI